MVMRVSSDKYKLMIKRDEYDRDPRFLINGKELPVKVDVDGASINSSGGALIMYSFGLIVIC
ncbi:hypothetical protein [Vulcanisaeta thermophila]|uniref:hypothetical protein n=1 Tax=Vulcanisaeta thermophila TaxID=867917 RepID=UPI0008532057|nr:hypothetical protein [Vulcanisaeta thermophila]